MAKPRRKNKETSGRDDRSPNEPAVEAITVAWIASITSVLMANLATIAAHIYAHYHPDSKTAALFEAIMLLTACLLGVASLALLAIVWRTCRLKPPKGFAGFAFCVAVAPILATTARLASS